MQFQDSDTTVAARWHGFVDLDSGIKWYHWCVGSTPSASGSDVCDVVSWRNVGIHTRIKLDLSKTLPSKFFLGNFCYTLIRYSLMGHVNI